MASSTGSSFLDHFAALRDPRRSWKVVYPLPEVLLTVLSGTLADAEDVVEIRRWARLHMDFLRRFHISSLALDAELFARAVREHWHGENRLHWTLDAVFHEDLSGLRSGHGPQNMATVRHSALNLLRAAGDKHSLKVRRRSAAWDDAYLEAIIRTKARSPSSDRRLDGDFTCRPRPSCGRRAR